MGEDRDVLDPCLNFGSILGALENRNALLNGIQDSQVRDGTDRVALGVDSQGFAYLADGAGGFTTETGGQFIGFTDTRRNITTKVDYVDLAWATGGAAWDIVQLRVGGLPAVSFTKAFVEIKTHEIEEQLELDLVASDPSVGFENLTGVVSGTGAGETASFDAQITGDGAAHSFDLLFVRPGTNVVLGSIPATINASDYLYPVQAVDADGAPIAYSLLESPDGAAIDAATGRISWDPPGVGTLHQYHQITAKPDHENQPPQWTGG